jgi:hypothetical protein
VREGSFFATAIDKLSLRNLTVELHRNGKNIAPMAPFVEGTLSKNAA